jgi:PIN domain nuclease of toxin-antitoxin system
MRLSARESQYFASTRERFLISAVSIWEIRLKWSAFHASGACMGPASPEDVVTLLRAEQNDFLPLTEEHAAAALAQPLAHHDPFDELLLAQAQVEGAQLLTRDRRLSSHPLAQTI